MNAETDDFAASELARRVQQGAAALAGDLKFLRALNDRLAPDEREIYRDHADAPPMIWLIGLPRSGTTLLMQVLAACLDLGYVNNLIARFWRAPLTGIRLSRIILAGRSDRSWRSDHGKTADPAGPHEFAYFWHWLLRMESMPPYVVASAAAIIDWALVRRVLTTMNATFGRPVLHKAMAPSYHLARFAGLFPDSLFVHLTRPRLAVAVSLAQARLHYYRDLNQWWSLYTEDYASLREEPYWRQIAGQVAYLEQLQGEALATLDPRRVIRLSYEELCAKPGLIVQRVHDALREWSGCHAALLAGPPDSFAATRPTAPQWMLSDLERGLAERGLAEG